MLDELALRAPGRADLVVDKSTDVGRDTHVELDGRFGAAPGVGSFDGSNGAG
jgi:hypothetical protein